MSARATRRTVVACACSTTAASRPSAIVSPPITARSSGEGWNATTGMPAVRNRRTSWASRRRKWRRGAVRRSKVIAERATDIGEETITRSGRSPRTRSAIPGYFRPVEIGGHHYVDGAAYSATNADLVLGLRPDLVIVSSPMSVARSAMTFDLRTAP
ncbi:MAG: hypothetical protein RL531_1499, partial [Actinomycetota bacterium]